MQQEAVDKVEALVQELKSKCTEFESKVSNQEKELTITKEQNHAYSKEISQCKEMIK